VEHLGAGQGAEEGEVAAVVLAGAAEAVPTRAAPIIAIT
jgi:hypothetical protein